MDPALVEKAVGAKVSQMRDESVVINTGPVVSCRYVTEEGYPSLIYSLNALPNGESLPAGKGRDFIDLERTGGLSGQPSRDWGTQTVDVTLTAGSVEPPPRKQVRAALLEIIDSLQASVKPEDMQAIADAGPAETSRRE